MYLNLCICLLKSREHFWKRRKTLSVTIIFSFSTMFSKALFQGSLTPGIAWYKVKPVQKNATFQLPWERSFFKTLWEKPLYFHFPQCFLTLSNREIVILGIFDLSSAKALISPVQVLIICLH